MSLDAAARRAEAQLRREAIAACRLCDDEGWISGRQHHGPERSYDAAVRCTHHDEPLPTGFTPDHGDQP